MKEVNHRFMLVQMLFRDVFIILMERLDIHFFIWKQKGRCVDLLEKSRSAVNVTIFMSAVKLFGAGNNFFLNFSTPCI